MAPRLRGSQFPMKGEEGKERGNFHIYISHTIYFDMLGRERGREKRKKGGGELEERGRERREISLAVLPRCMDSIGLSSREERERE